MNSPSASAFEDVVLETPRLQLRTVRADDVLAVFAIYANAEVARYLGEPMWTDPSRAEAWVQRVMRQRLEGQALQLLLQRREDAAVLGTCVLFHFHVASRRAEIGYVLAREHWGQGYAHEALTALIGHGFNAIDLRRIEADIDPRNVASARVLQRLGFVREGRLRERWEVAGEISDTEYWGLLRREWCSKPI